MQACIDRSVCTFKSTYQPGTRYWAFQGIESAIFVALALGLLVFSLWWMHGSARVSRPSAKLGEALGDDISVRE